MYKKIQTLKKIFNETWEIFKSEILANPVKADLGISDLRNAATAYHDKLNVAIDNVYTDEHSNDTHLAVNDLAISVRNAKKALENFKVI